MPERPPVIDMDGHIEDRPAEIRKYLEPPWDRRPGPVTPGDQPWDRNLFGTIPRYPDFGRNLNPAEQIEAWVKIMDANGVERVVLFGATGSVTKLREPDFAVAACRAINTHLAKDWNALSDRTHVLGVLPLQRPVEAAQELRRAVTELGMLSFEILPTGLSLALGDPCYDPIYAEAQRLNVPLAIRGTPSHSQGIDGGQLHSFNEVHTYALPAAMLLQFTSMIFQGVPVRFPGLRLAFLEIGATWLPYWLDRMNEHWELRGDVEAPNLKQKPSDVVRESHIYVSVDPGETLLPQAIEYLGDSHFVYGSDLPHWDHQFPASIDEIWTHPGLSTSAKENILYHNASAFLGR